MQTKATNMSPLSLGIQTLFALIAFAGNSVLCRLALQDNAIDPNSFTIIRLSSGALILCVLMALQLKSLQFISRPSLGRLKQASFLFIYAACFSFAYVLLGTAAGALLLFVTVQLTMLLTQYLQGRRSTGLELFGLCLALGSFMIWMGPNASRPDLTGALLMVAAGIAWAFYTIAGKQSQQPQLDTAQNFLFSLCFIVILMPIYLWQNTLNLSYNGILLAISSGAITSGLGYWLWYRVLPAFSSLSAGVMQLSVPILAAAGGFIWNQEQVTMTFILASSGILGGIFLVLYSAHLASKRTH